MPHDASDFETEFEQALAAYTDPSDAGHPQTLTARVVAAIDARRRRTHWWFGVSVTAPVLACLLVMAVLWLRRPDSQHRALEIASVPTTPSTAPVVTAVPKATVAGKPYLETARHQVVHSASRPLPKLDQFPAPTPMTEQERLLVQFVAHAPPRTQQLVAKARKKSDEPLHIAELSIPYLNSSTQPQ